VDCLNQYLVERSKELGQLIKSLVEIKSVDAFDGTPVINKLEGLWTNAGELLFKANPDGVAF
jgi:hypothetical protein